MRHFLLIYDHNKRTLRSRREFSDNECDDATQAYQDAEAEYRDEEGIEIVLIGADSIETVRRTHGHYFGPREDRLARYLRPA